MFLVHIWSIIDILDFLFKFSGFILDYLKFVYKIPHFVDSNGYFFAKKDNILGEWMLSKKRGGLVI